MERIDPLAVELNEVIREQAPNLFQSFSSLGRELFFPQGILTQTAEAKQQAHRYNATIGMATLRGRPLYLRSLRKYIKHLKPEETFPYAPTTGIMELRLLWRDHQRTTNPGLEDKSTSLPIVTNGLTHGLSIMADMFCDAGDCLLLPEKMWGNYRMIFATRRGAELLTYPFFDEGGRFNVRGFYKSLLAASRKGKVLLLLNFPHNPTGYSPHPVEATSIRDAIIEVAETGANLVVGVDDAYAGLLYENDLYPESLFSLLADCHPHVTAIKIDGPTKEDYVWGFRLGFITFSHDEGGNLEAVYSALEKKVGGLIRGTISKSSTPSQSLLAKAIKSVGYHDEKTENYQLLRDRYEEVKRVLSQDRFAEAFSPYPFNSGYFFCLRVHGVNAEELRRHLLEAYGVGVVATDDTDLRIAYSCLEKEQIGDLFDILYTAVEEMKKTDKCPYEETNERARL